MHHNARQNTAALLALALLLTSWAPAARADGSLSFTTSATTVTAGKPFSWMEAARDIPPGATPTPIGGIDYPVPSQTQNIDVTTSRTSSALVMNFVIPDNTTSRPSGMGAIDCSGVVAPQPELCNGDEIIIQIDPDNSGHSGGAGANTLSAHSPFSTTYRGIDSDYRFEIFLNDNVTDPPDATPIDRLRTGYKLPTSGTAWSGR